MEVVGVVEWVVGYVGGVMVVVVDGDVYCVDLFVDVDDDVVVLVVGLYV